MNEFKGNVTFRVKLWSMLGETFDVHLQTEK